MNVQELTDRLADFADKTNVFPGSAGYQRSVGRREGRKVALSRLLRDLKLPDGTIIDEEVLKHTERIVPSSLGEILGYQPIVIDANEVYDAAEAEANPDKNAKGQRKFPTYEQVLKALTERVITAVENTTGLKYAKKEFSLGQISGKGDKGFVYIEGKSVPFMIGDKNMYRLGDGIKPVVTYLGTSDIKAFTRVPKEGLGDGTFIVAPPSQFGLAEGMIDFAQVRGMVFNKAGVEIHRFYKGTVIFHPDAQRIMAWDDGYGQELEEGTLKLYLMALGSEFNPDSSFTIQGLSYQGVPGYERFLFSNDNIHRMVDAESRILEERAIAADAPIEALGGQGLQILLSRQTNMAIRAGRARIMLPAKAFAFIEGLEHIAEIEHDTDRYDNEHTFSLESDPGPGAPGRLLPRFYAPHTLKGYYQAHGGKGSQWAFNRVPDLSTGQCVLRHELAGYVPFNALVVNTTSMKMTGTDFDGDIGKTLPTRERGGLYICFNDLPYEEQRKRLAKATVDRSADKGKRTYKDGLHRWAGQIYASRILGMADIGARRFLDMGLRDEAYAMQPWVQWSVDKQKHDKEPPHPDGPDAMPVSRLPEGETTMTDLLRGISKGKRGDRKKMAPFVAEWHRYESKIDALLQASLENNVIHAQGGMEAAITMRHWAQRLFNRIKKAELLVPTHKPKYGSVKGKRYPVAHVVNGYPNLAAPKDPNVLPEIPWRLKLTLEYLDKAWDEAYDKGGAIRTGLFNLKDALLDIALSLDITAKLALHARTYRVFRVFATVPQLRAYFAHVKNKTRVSEIFANYDEREAFMLDTQHLNAKHPEQVTVVNKHPVSVGMGHFDTGMLRFTRNPDKTWRMFAQQDTPVDFPTIDFEDALVHARAHLNLQWVQGAIEEERAKQAAQALLGFEHLPDPEVSACAAH